MTDAQKRATAKYDAKNTTQIHLKLNLTTDADILDRLRTQHSTQGYIKSLIRADIDKQEGAKSMTITCTERITLAPSHAHSIMHPHDTTETYLVYTIDGERYIEVSGDTRGGKLLSRLDADNLHVDGGILKISRHPRRVPNDLIPIIYTDNISALTDITGSVHIG